MCTLLLIASEGYGDSLRQFMMVHLCHFELHCRLLAMGLMEYNSDWKAIQQRFLPCKTKHQVISITNLVLQI